MTRELDDLRFDSAAQPPAVSPQGQVVLLLLNALQKLADAGEVDASCRIAGRACVILRGAAPRDERRFNALLHRLTPRLAPREQREGDM
ncbi:hypothetical protein M2427_001507 [Bradyrhizobium sp. BR13661]|jgi:hypothetical protein|nr:hypothetical protein [Bradyrhizobium sp. BR13661]